MDISTNVSHRQFSRLAELRVHNLEHGKRAFGKDLTNLERRIKKNVSIYEKPSVALKVEAKIRSRSLYGQKDPNSLFCPLPTRDALTDYKQDIVDFMVKLLKVEISDKQKQISDKMRYILVDWIIDVHESFELKEQTLHLALSYLADYCNLKQVSKEDFQLVGIACLWIASKYEEIYPPRTRNYIEVTADSYSLRDLKNMESSVLEVLNFDLNRTTAIQLLEAMYETEVVEAQKVINAKTLSLCKYAIQTAMFEGLSRKYNPLTLLCAAVNLAEGITKHKLEVRTHPTLKVDQKETMECFKEMNTVMQTTNKLDLTSLRRKYAKAKHHQVSKTRLTME